MSVNNDLGGAAVVAGRVSGGAEVRYKLIVISGVWLYLDVYIPYIIGK